MQLSLFRFPKKKSKAHHSAARPSNPVNSRSIQPKLTLRLSGICFILFFIPLFMMSVNVSAQVDILIEQSKYRYDGIKSILLNAAELLPEEDYDFRPTDEVRSFAEIVAHLVESSYFFCSDVLEEEDTAPHVEGVVDSKTELIRKLHDAAAYCDKAYSTLNERTAVELVESMGAMQPKLEVLNTNQIHLMLHYGNMVTYLRMNGLVPPTSDMEFIQQLMSR